MNLIKPFTASLNATADVIVSIAGSATTAASMLELYLNQAKSDMTVSYAMEAAGKKTSIANGIALNEAKESAKINAELTNLGISQDDFNKRIQELLAL